MAYYGDDDYDYFGRRRSPGRGYNSRRQAFLDPGAGLYRTRSQGHSPVPTVNIYNDQIQDNRPASPYAFPSPPAPYPSSPEMRGRGRLGDELVEDLADMALRDRVRSRSRGRSDVAMRSDLHEIHDWQRERDYDQLSRKEAMERAELRKLRDDKNREEENERLIAEHEAKKRKEADRAKAEKERIKYELEKEKFEKEEKEKKEWDEFLRKQAAKKAKEEKEKKEAEEKLQEEMRKRLAKFGYTENQIEVMIDEEKAKKYREGRGRSPRGGNGQLVAFRGERAPVYAKIHRDYLSVDTLIYYDIPYEYDRVGLPPHTTSRHR